MSFRCPLLSPNCPKLSSSPLYIHREQFPEPLPWSPLRFFAYLLGALPSFRCLDSLKSTCSVCSPGPSQCLLRSLHGSGPFLSLARSPHWSIWGGSSRSSHRPSPSGVLLLIPLPLVPLQVPIQLASLIPLPSPVLGSPWVLGFTCGISRSPPHLAFPIPLGIPSLTSGPTRSPLYFAVPDPILVLSLTRSPSRGPPRTPRPGPSRSPEALTTRFPGCSWPLLRVPVPGLRLSLWRPRSHLSTVTRDPVATAFSHSCPESLSCRVLACCVPTRSLRPRVRVALHSPRRTLAAAAAAVRGAAPPGVANRTRLRGARPAPTRLRPRLRPLPRSDRLSTDLT